MIARNPCAARLALSLLLGACLLIPACAKEWDVDRRDPDETIDLDYDFNAADAREIARAMTADALSKPWLDQWMAGHEGERPLVVVGNVRNETDEYIETGLFTNPIQEELLNSGRIRVKAQRELRDELREERLDIDFNDPASVKAAAMEVNADLILLGVMNYDRQKAKSGDKLVQYYQVTLELVNLETAEKVWIYNHPIQKLARR